MQCLAQLSRIQRTVIELCSWSYGAPSPPSYIAESVLSGVFSHTVPACNSDMESRGQCLMNLVGEKRNKFGVFLPY